MPAKYGGSRPKPGDPRVLQVKEPAITAVAVRVGGNPTATAR